MAQAHMGPDGTEIVPQQGKVGNVRQQWMVYEDGAIAHNEQEKEYQHKFDWNRKDRRTARKDVPMARVCQTEEEERKQREAMERLEHNKEIVQRDAIEAEKMMSAMILEEQRSRIAREMQDQRVAAVLQEQEKKKYEQKLQERALNKEHFIDNDRNTALDAQRRILRSDGKVEDLGDFSDFYIPPDETMADSDARHLREMQDEELARLLQDQEHKRGGQIDKDKLKAIEAQDEELARVMQEQEKLRLMKKKAKHEARRQLSQPAYIGTPPQGDYPPQRAQSDQGDRRRPPGGYPPSDDDYADRGQHYPPPDPSRPPVQQNSPNGGGNVFSSIDPTVVHSDVALHSNNNVSPHYPPQEPVTPTGDEDGYCELGDLSVVQGQRREMSKRGSAKKSTKKGQCKQQ